MQATPSNKKIAPIPNGAEVLTYSTRWSRMDGNVMLCPAFRGLSSGAKVVYTYLGLFINHETRSWQVSVAVLSEYTGYMARSVRRALAELDAVPPS